MIKVNRMTVMRGEKTLVENVSFQLNSGKILGVYGPNGSGKSTLLKSISIRPDFFQVTGDVQIAGKALSSYTDIQDRVRTILYLGSDFRSPFDLKVKDLLEMSVQVGSKSLWPSVSREDRDRMSAVVERLGVAPWLERVFRSLSDGEKQWVMFARALIQDAKILIFDETFSKLDLDRLLLTAQHLRLRAQDGGTVIVCSHDLNFLAEVSDEILLLKSGIAIQYGSVDEIYQPEVLEKIYFNLSFKVVRNDRTGRPRVIY